MQPPYLKLRATAAVLLCLSAGLTSPSSWAQSSERESLEQLRQTTLALIEALVQTGSLPRDKADSLVADAQKRGAAAAVVTASAEPTKAEPPVVRVLYVPQVVRDQIRNEVREEVLARARTERWGVPAAVAEWTDRLSIEGDVRVRAQTDEYDKNNPTPLDFVVASSGLTTRAPDLAAGSSVGQPLANTLEERNRSRVRARLGFNVRLNDIASTGLRLSTGSSTDRVSTNQTLGQNFNRYTFLVDRAFVKLDPAEWLSMSAGRVPNPWFSSDLVFSENLSFEGAAATVRRPASPAATLLPFATVGYFPVREGVAPRKSRSLVGAQVGVQWEASTNTRVRLGLASYTYQNFEGQIESDYDPVTGPGRSYGQYEYEASLRQRGNTLFVTNNDLELPTLTSDRVRWGLASRFKPMVLTAAAEFSQFAPLFIGITAEYVRNSAFDRDEIARRTRVSLTDARNTGAQLRGTFGAQQVRNGGDWQANLTWRWLGSDAVPDAFVDSDLVLGGTNIKGVVVGLNYGLARDTALGLRYLSGRTISSPTVQPALANRFGATTWQVDLNARF